MVYLSIEILDSAGCSSKMTRDRVSQVFLSRESISQSLPQCLGSVEIVGRALDFPPGASGGEVR